MSVFTNTTITLSHTAGGSRQFVVNSVEDDSFRIINKNKQLLNWSAKEYLLGHIFIISVRFRPLSDEEREYLYRFCVGEYKGRTIIVNGVTYNVELVDEEMSINLLENYIDAQTLTLELRESTINRVTTPSRTQGVLTQSQGYRASFSQKGTYLKLGYDYGSGLTEREFLVAKIDSFSSGMQRRNFTYIDDEDDYTPLGRKRRFAVEFGTLPMQTPAQQQDDRDFIREFCLAPYKELTTTEQSTASGDTTIVVNGFDEVRYELFGGNIYGKMLTLNFIEKEVYRPLLFENYDEEEFENGELFTI